MLKIYKDIKNMKMTSRQCKAARSLLGWNQDDLAGYSCLGTATVRIFESPNNTTTQQKSTMKLLLDAFNKAGILFSEEDGAGVYLQANK